MNRNILLFAAASTIISGCVLPVSSPSDKVVLEKIKAIDRLADKNPELAIAGYIAMDPRGAIVTMINTGKDNAKPAAIEATDDFDSDKPVVKQNLTTGDDQEAPEEDLQKEFEAWRESGLD